MHDAIVVVHTATISAIVALYTATLCYDWQ